MLIRQDSIASTECNMCLTGMGGEDAQLPLVSITAWLFPVLVTNSTTICNTFS